MGVAEPVVSFVDGKKLKSVGCFLFSGGWRGGGSPLIPPKHSGLPQAENVFGEKSFGVF